jgi:hypothetical protein
MKPHDIFNLAMRLIGLLFLYQGLSAVPAAVANFCPVFPHFNFRSLLPSLFLVGWPLLVGMWMVKGAPWLMRRAYPNYGNPTVGDPKI